MSKQQLPRILIVELGSQYTLLIERTLRELGHRSVVVGPDKARTWLENHRTQAIILSGSEASVYQKDAIQPPAKVLTTHNPQIPILGICYGMQWMVRRLGGEVVSVGNQREYGDASIQVADRRGLFTDLPHCQNVWASHGDSVTQVPRGFLVTARASDGSGIAALENKQLGMYGVQFHPEVTHTVNGKEILSNFVRGIAGCQPDWSPRDLVAQIRQEVADNVGQHEKVIFGFSGGVDSTTLAAIVAPELKDRFLAVTIDGGHLREGELEEIRHHAALAGVNHVVVDVRDHLNIALAPTIDPQEKRQIFRQIYSSCLQRAAEGFGASVIIQGTLAPDRIESGATGGDCIKTHHNVGLDLGKCRQLHPLGHLFKYEVRALARSLGLPESVSNRMPFPGPGLILRVVGMPATLDKITIVRWATARVEEVLKKHSLLDSETISQLVVYILGSRSVGVKGDQRVHGYSIVVRAVQTLDFMTARGLHFSEEVENEITTALIRHQEVVRVLYDPTDKPPATTEPE